MTARRDSTKRLLSVPDVADARVGGRGLDWLVLPELLDAVGMGEWQRLGTVYAGDLVRFREGDRQIVVAYCLAWSVYASASAQLIRDGLIVEGRSAPDRGRQVKSPSMTIWTQAGSQLRYLARELGLTPDARGRSGFREHETSDGSDLLSPSRLLS
jgi:P27 family predicted phage terminase small subunit